MSILSFSLQGEVSGILTAWEREIATYARDSGKVLDDEVKTGTFLIRESLLKTHLLMPVDTLKKWTGCRGVVVAISRAIATAKAQPTPMDVGAMSQGAPDKGSKGSHQVPHVCPTWRGSEHTNANFPHADKTWGKCGKIGHIAPACGSSGQVQPPKGKLGGKNSKRGKRFGQNVTELC